jgi:hypothetical protein
MKTLLASIAALGLLASAGSATAAATTTKTMVTKSGNAKATTTVSTKVTPVAKRKHHVRKMSHKRHHATRRTAKMTRKVKPAASEKTSG